MKKLFILLALVASLCSCADANKKRANELIAEYQQKYELASQEVNNLMVPFSEEEWNYVLAYAAYYANETAIVVGENWDLNMQPLKEDRLSLAGKVEKAKIPLTSAQQAVCSKYAEAEMYLITTHVLRRWLEIH
ncbi:MAG: hypothetical protein IJ870_05625 [Alphaproteobacteria bacterium]|nr:hypothetical protein [Alphaproteobacteria bacterium]